MARRIVERMFSKDKSIEVHIYDDGAVRTFMRNESAFAIAHAQFTGEQKNVLLVPRIKRSYENVEGDGD